MNIKNININGYDTYFTEEKDKTGAFLLIAIPSYADKDMGTSKNLCTKARKSSIINI